MAQREDDSAPLHGRPPPASGGGESRLTRLFAFDPHDLAGLPLSAGAALCMMSSYFYLQPLSDTLALKVGVENTPAITSVNIVLIAIINPVYGALVKALPVAKVLPRVYAVIISVLILFGVCFTVLPESLALSFTLAVFVGTLSLFLTTTFWARMASLHSKAEVRRVYGFIAAGAQVGQLCASLTAGTLFSFLQQRVVFLSALLIAACSYLVGLRGELWEPPSTSDSGGTAKQRANEEPVNGGGAMCGGRCGADTGLARGCCRSVQVLLSTPLLRAITLHTLLYTFLVSGIWYERAVSVSAAFHDDEGRYDFFATLNSLVGAFTLLVQVFCFSHLLRLLGPRGALVFEPIIVALGLGVNFVHPGLLSIALLDGGRKVLHYALLKPTKEGLYAALGSDAQFVAKPLLDTLVYRVGSLLGATYFTAAVKGGIGADARRTILLFVTLAWLGNSYYLGGLASQKDAGSADASDGRDGCKPAQAAQASEDPSPPAGRGGKGDQYSGVELSPADGDGDESAADGLASGDGEALRHARRPPPASPIRLALFLALAGSFLAFGVYASVAKALSGRHRHHAHAPPPAPLPTVAAVALAQSALPREAAPRQPPPLPSPLPLSPPPPPP